MPSHRIHLRGPWDYVWRPSMSDSLNVVSTTGVVTMPREWRTIFGDALGSAQFRRKFHCPTNLDPHEQVMLVFTEVRGCGDVHLNESLIGQFSASGESIEFDLSRLLKPFNEISVNISFDPHDAAGLSGGLFGVTALEIR